jgi:hypothetical protein
VALADVLLAYPFHAARWEHSRLSEPRMARTCHKIYTEKPTPTPGEVCQLETVLWRRHTLYNAALEQRNTIHRQRGVSVSRYQEEAELKTIRAEVPMLAHVYGCRNASRRAAQIQVCVKRRVEQSGAAAQET